MFCSVVTHYLCGVSLLEGHTVRFWKVDVCGGLPRGSRGVGTLTWEDKRMVEVLVLPL